MSLKLKTLGVVVAAVFALSALGASAASAGEFTEGTTTGSVTAVQTTGHVFTTNAGTVTCTTAHFTGTWSESPAASQVVSPKYENCKAFGFINVPIHTNGCTYRFTANATGEVHIECPAGKEIEITAPGCTTKVGPQTLGGNTYTDTTNPATGKMDVLIHTDITGPNTIKYNECGTARTNGTYTGTSTTTGVGTDGKPTDITVHFP